ncbi:MAG: HD-GYP domain-containing protein, partial [Chloroflexota bacterium]|nr:HD-GYP domain-containing protein [Chloroflexota bacterium]
PYTDGHSRRVSALGVLLARALGRPPEEFEKVRVAGLLHDIGKIAIPEVTLHKAGPLTEEEWAQMRSHPDVGLRILTPIAALRAVLPAVRCHHERWDGQGYPLGISGEEIPLGARIIAICDAYDTMVSDRPYRRALGHEEAVARLRAAAGTQFDSELVKAFTQLPLATSPRAVAPVLAS